MRRLFLGKPLHWALLALLVALGWAAGRIRLHVTDFNLFVLGLLALTIAVLATVLSSSPPGDKVTRDPVRPPEDEQTS